MSISQLTSKKTPKQPKITVSSKTSWFPWWGQNQTHGAMNGAHKHAHTNNPKHIDCCDPARARGVYATCFRDSLHIGMGGSQHGTSCLTLFDCTQSKHGLWAMNPPPIFVLIWVGDVQSTCDLQWYIRNTCVDEIALARCRLFVIGADADPSQRQLAVGTLSDNSFVCECTNLLYWLLGRHPRRGTRTLTN